MRRLLNNITGGASATPLAVLFGLNFVDELDQILFGIVTPEIRDDLGLSDAGIIVIGALVSVFVLLAVMPLTYVADRWNRVRLVFFAALGWTSMSVLTGISGWAGLVVLLVIARMGSGLGRTVNDPVHASLLTDYYEPHVQPRVFEVHRAANPVSRVTAVVIGAGVGVLGWQAMFLVLAAPTALLIGAALRLPEPPRRSSAVAASSLVTEDEESVRFLESRRTLFAIRSMRRLYLGAFLLGFGFITLGTILSLFFEDVYGFSPTMRGVAAFLAGVGSLVGLNIGQRLATRSMSDERPEALASITGLAFTGGAAGLVLMALSPWAWVSLFFSMVASAGFLAFQPAYYPLVALVTPSKVRTQAYGWSLILVGCGGLVGALFIGTLAESSYRSATAGLAVIVALAGIVGASAKSLVAADIGAATPPQSAAQPDSSSSNGVASSNGHRRRNRPLVAAGRRSAPRR